MALQPYELPDDYEPPPEFDHDCEANPVPRLQGSLNAAKQALRLRLGPARAPSSDARSLPHRA